MQNDELFSEAELDPDEEMEIDELVNEERDEDVKPDANDGIVEKKELKKVVKKIKKEGSSSSEVWLSVELK